MFDRRLTVALWRFQNVFKTSILLSVRLTSRQSALHSIDVDLETL